MEFLTNEELRRDEWKYRQQAAVASSLAERCVGIRQSRDAAVALNEAENAKNKAAKGICSKGIGDCPVHQMGSCRVPTP